MNDQQDNDQDAGAQQAQAQFTIKKVYLKDLSYEAPDAPAVFSEQIEPSVDLHFHNKTSDIGNDHHEVILTVTATLKTDERTIYLVEVQQAGVFNITGVPEDQLGPILATTCPNVLLPFAREVVCDIVTKGGFPQLLIAPVNFEILYMQEMQRRQQQDTDGEAVKH